MHAAATEMSQNTTCQTTNTRNTRKVQYRHTSFTCRLLPKSATGGNSPSVGFPLSAFRRGPTAPPLFRFASFFFRVSGVLRQLLRLHCARSRCVRCAYLHR